MFENITEDKMVHVIIRKNQELLQSQIDLLDNKFGEQWKYYRVPSINWTPEDQHMLAKYLINCKVVITSDMPYFIASVAYNRGYKDGYGLAEDDMLYIFNEKKTNVNSLNNIQQSEWELLLI